MAKPRVKAGTSKSAAAARRRAFVVAYIANGRNETQAAITAGFSPKSAHAQAARLLKDVRTLSLIDELVAPALAASGITVERALKKLECVTFCDPRKLYDSEGNAKPIQDIDDDTAAAISGLGQNGFQTYDALRGLDMTMKHLGLYERDNAQRGDSLALQIVLVK